MKAVKSTRQVTKAMELVAASKMRKAVSSAESLRSYATGAWDILQEISEAHPELHPFLTDQKAKNVLVVLLTSDRGLCGSLNMNVCRTLEKYVERAKKEIEFRTDFVAVGRKGQQFLKRIGQEVSAAFPAYSNHPTFRDILPLSKLILDGYKNGTYDHVVLVYPRFVSPLVQEAELKVLLPFSETAFDVIAHDGVRKEKTDVREFAFEPSAAEVLDAVLPQLTETQVYQAILEAAASEHSARMVAMRNASENASEILDDLTLTYNQTRQANITAELAELSGAAAALQ